MKEKPDPFCYNCGEQGKLKSVFNPKLIKRGSMDGGPSVAICDKCFKRAGELGFVVGNE